MSEMHPKIKKKKSFQNKANENKTLSMSIPCSLKAHTESLEAYFSYDLA